MKQLTLLKQHPCVQLGHLYEHIFCNQVKALMYQKKLFKHTDYTLAGNTYENGGVIEIKLALGTTNACKLEKKIKNLSIDISNESVSLALKQITAEENYLLASSSEQEVIKELKLLDSREWLQAEDISLIDTKKIKKRCKPIKLINNPKPPLSRVTTIVVIDNKFAMDNRVLIPLFYAIMLPILHTAQDKLSVDFGGYCNDLYFEKKIFKSTLLMATKNSLLDLNQFRDVILENMKYQIDSGICDKILNQLQNNQTIDSLYDYTTDVFIGSGVYIGIDGWKKIATSYNVSKILPNIAFEFRTGDIRLIERFPN